MKAIAYQHCKHHECVCEWSAGHGLGEPPGHVLPDTGVVVEGVCALFLYLTNSSVGFCESLIVNPEASHEEINEAIPACFQELEKLAARHGVSILWATTFIPGVVERAKEQGFRVHPRSHKLITKRVLWDL
jgi:hypothetical protein